MNRIDSRRVQPGEVTARVARAQDRASVLPAFLAGLAESAVLYLPLHDVAANEGRVVAGPMAHYPLFVLVFAGAVGVATRLRGFSKLLPMVGASAVAIGVIQGVWWGEGDSVAATTSVVLWLLVALRVFTLALRDWRDPISRSFGVGAGGLLAEIILMGGFAEPRSVLPVAVPQFFLASLASRAASIRLSARPVTVRSGRQVRITSRAEGRRTIGVALGAIVAFALLMGAAILLGGRDGGLLVLGRLILAAVIPVVAYVLAPVARFLVGALAWLFALLNIDLSPLRSLGETIEDFSDQPPPATTPGSGPVGRVLALVVLLALAFLLVRTVRARWRRFERKGDGEEEPLQPMPILSSRRRRRRFRPGRELPADTVRRWYAEALLVLERLGLPKAPARTPGEYLRQVERAFPECAPGFTALTRAYEDVRYGSLRFDLETLGKLEANRQLAMAALGRARRLERGPMPEREGP